VSYTFDEAMKILADAEQQGLGGSALSTFVVTQDDSRTAWGRGNLYRYANNRLGNLGHVSDPSFVFAWRFSDRQAFTGQMDLVGLDVTRVSATKYRGDVVLYAWGGAKYSVDLVPAQKGNMLIGYGPTIGYGPDAALHCISIQNVSTGPIEFT
jgi:hypothetical protein